MNEQDRHARPAGEDGVLSFDLLYLLHILWAQRYLLVGLALIVFVPMLIWIASKPKVYEAKSTILLQNHDFNVGNYIDTKARDKIDFATLETQIKLITSTEIVRKTARALRLHYDADDRLQLGIYPDGEPIEAGGNPFDRLSYEKRMLIINNLSNDFDVSLDGRSHVINIAYRSTDPEFVSLVANTHAKAFVTYQKEQKRQDIVRLNEWIYDQILQLREESSRKSQAVQRFREESQMVKGRDTEELLYQQISDTAADLTLVQGRRAELEAQANALRNETGDGLQALMDSRLIQELKAEQSQVEQELQSLRTQYGPNHPAYIESWRRSQQIAADIRRESQNIRGSVENQLAAVKQREALLSDRLDDLKTEAAQLEDKGVDLQSLLLEEAASEKLLDSFLARFGEIKAQIELPKNNARIMSLSDVPIEPVGPRRTLLAMAAAVASGIVSAIIVLLHDLFAGKINNREYILNILKLRVIASLPRVKDPSLEFYNNRNSVYVREIRRMYLHLGKTNHPQALLVTSSEPGEGKSSVAVALATYLHGIGKRVIILDTDSLNATTIEAVPDYPPKPAATSQNMVEALKATPPIRTNEQTGVSVMSFHEYANISTDMLFSDHFPNVLNNLKDQYDFIIIDASPVERSSDAEVLASQVDHVIILTEWAKTAKRKLRQTVEAIRTFTSSYPKIVLNKVHSPAFTA